MPPKPPEAPRTRGPAFRTRLIPEGYRRCPGCQEIKPLEAFGRPYKTKPRGQSRCLACLYVMPCTLLARARRDAKRRKRPPVESPPCPDTTSPATRPPRSDGSSPPG